MPKQQRPKWYHRLMAWSYAQMLITNILKHIYADFICMGPLIRDVSRVLTRSPIPPRLAPPIKPFVNLTGRKASTPKRLHYHHDVLPQEPEEVSLVRPLRTSADWTHHSACRFFNGPKKVGLIKAESRSELRAFSYFNRSPRVDWFEAIYWANYEKKNKCSNPTQLCIHPDGRFFFWRPVQCGVSALPLHCLAPLLFACLHN